MFPLYKNISGVGQNDPIEKIKSAKILYEQVRLEKEKYDKLEALAFNDYVNTLKNSIVPHPILSVVENAERWIAMKCEKLDKRKKYDEKYAYDYLTKLLVRDFIGNFVDVVEIFKGGYEGYLHGVVFTHNGIKYLIEIPDIERINNENVCYTHYGQYTLYYYTNESVCDFIASSYKEDEIKDAFNKFLETLKK